MSPNPLFTSEKPSNSSTASDVTASSSEPTTFGTTSATSATNSAAVSAAAGAHSGPVGTLSSDPTGGLSGSDTARDEAARTRAHQGGDDDGMGAKKMSKEEADRLYEERIEEEYAKREGGA